MKTDDGGPAFAKPLPGGMVKPDEVLRILQECRGMSVLDFFAAFAAAGLISGTLATGHPLHRGAEGVAETAYDVAEEMVAERKRRTT